MPFHEIREVSFSSAFNSVLSQRRGKEETRGGAKRHLIRGRSESRTPNPEKEVDLWA